MVHGPVTRKAPAGDGAVATLLASVALALTSGTFLLAAAQVLQRLQFVSMPGLALF